MTTTAATGAADAFRLRAEQWLGRSVPERWKAERGALSEAEIDEIRLEWDRRLFRGGFAGISLPAEYGGQGLGLREEVAFHELAARAHAPEGFGRIGKILVAPALIADGTQAQRARYLPPILRGDHVWCQGFSEPGAGSDLASVSTVARAVPGGYLVRGQKVWTSFADKARKCLLLAKSDPEAPRYRNLTMFLVDMDQPGVTASPIRQISGASHFSEVFFENAFVAEEDRLGPEGEGWRVAMGVLNHERGAVEGVTRYVEMRGDLDRLIACCAGRAGTCSPVADFDTRLELVRWQISKTVAYQEDQARSAAAASVLKVTWSELWQEIAEYGLGAACPDHHAHWRNQYLETRATSIYSGSNEIQRNVIGDRILGLPR
ncbi:acyl-CoA dehydrogenase family protein [Acrocarpospora catenulata]|uniref:acyl-CoA dehydrogenase family protein n=1 Tax=Acrocarpospora catenulata TaxID=2836182 RepID=UPI001BDA5A4A|nr:acyl-CoA dehydrogenase family protein [Acrocarpospora catenulata]